MVAEGTLVLGGMAVAILGTVLVMIVAARRGEVRGGSSGLTIGDHVLPGEGSSIRLERSDDSDDEE